VAKIAAGIATSVYGYVAGPNDGPGRGLGEDGERLHHWVLGRYHHITYRVVR
jgi:hypothetical protein